MNIDLAIEAREGGHHSGNWGGLLSSPAIQLIHAIASITGPTGQIRIPEWVPPPISASVKRALADCEVEHSADGPAVDTTWGEPGLTGPEKVFGWSSFEVLAMTSGNPETPVNAVPPRAWARVQLRFVVGVDKDRILPALRAHLDRHGFPFVTIKMARDEAYAATRLDPEHPWAQWTAASLRRSTNGRVTILPNVGGSLPNDIFSEGLGLPTIWIPHSYPGCSQHAPDEHLPLPLAREALRLMAGVYWDLGEPGTPSGKG
jgi:acetylornithine deacetylase/succinyl-diaminopimelate desuccinylase-like protein